MWNLEVGIAERIPNVGLEEASFRRNRKARKDRRETPLRDLGALGGSLFVDFRMPNS
jgi:hypothetical protein